MLCFYNIVCLYRYIFVPFLCKKEGPQSSHHKSGKFNCNPSLNITIQHLPGALHPFLYAVFPFSCPCTVRLTKMKQITCITMVMAQEAG